MDYIMNTRMKIIEDPGTDSGKTIFIKKNDDDFGPFMIGEGKINLVCGSCKHVLIKGTSLGQVTNTTFKCPKCLSFNQC